MANQVIPKMRDIYVGPFLNLRYIVHRTIRQKSTLPYLSAIAYGSRGVHWGRWWNAKQYRILNKRLQWCTMVKRSKFNLPFLPCGSDYQIQHAALVVLVTKLACKVFYIL